MRIVIVGAGALGGLVGAQLADSGEDVTLVEINQARTKLLNETGLFISAGAKGERCDETRQRQSASLFILWQEPKRGSQANCRTNGIYL